MKPKSRVMGVYAPPPRPCLGAAILLASLLSLPFVAIAIIEFL